MLAIVVAAGRSSRMGDGPKKQYRLLSGRPVLARTLEVLARAPSIGGIVLVVAAGEEDWCRREIVARFGLVGVLAVVPGGAVRQESVWAGLRALPRCGLVLVHDGVRPFVTPDQIAELAVAARECGAATLAVPPKDTVKLGAADGVSVATLPRERLWLVQTPQVFRYDLLVEAHRLARERGFEGTDDTSLAELVGHTVRMVRGSYANIKITTPEDFTFAEALLGSGPVRTGFGYDVHRLVDDRKLVLGGVEVPFDRGLLGHSDADVLVHAVIDALLGAAGAGDIGRLFPDDDPAFRDISSLALLDRVVVLLRERGLELENLDAVLVAQAPRLAPYVSRMEENLARALGVSPGAVNVKATTTEGLGFAGVGAGMAGYAVVALRRVVSPVTG
jgi:2-C-methyl-D-erythritol 4-phosphate cytidylyltransferase/2-C-methyl-D-erythritol 2,4-cyclodiphosphate synthase